VNGDQRSRGCAATLALLVIILALLCAVLLLAARIASGP
jgi:hypothetical protein